MTTDAEKAAAKAAKDAEKAAAKATFNPSVIPAWVSEGSVRKYHRAVELIRKENRPMTEEAVKELYTRWGGLVLTAE